MQSFIQGLASLRLLYLNWQIALTARTVPGQTQPNLVIFSRRNRFRICYVDGEETLRFWLVTLTASCFFCVLLPWNQLVRGESTFNFESHHLDIKCGEAKHTISQEAFKAGIRFSSYVRCNNKTYEEKYGPQAVFRAFMKFLWAH